MPLWVRTEIKKKNQNQKLTALCSYSSTPHPHWVRARRKIPTNHKSSYSDINYKDFSPIMQNILHKGGYYLPEKKDMNLEINKKLDK